MNLLDLVKNADHDTLMMSYKHCHCPNVDSIVYENNDGKLKRFFLAWPDHNLWMNQIGFGVQSVAFHNHKYNVKITPVIGSPYNVIAKIAKDYEKSDFDLFRFIYNNDKQFYLVSNKLNRLKIESCILLEKSVELFKDDIHTIYVPTSQHAAWIVEEGEQFSNESLCWAYPKPIKYNDLYQRFDSAEDIIKTVEKFISYN